MITVKYEELVEGLKQYDYLGKLKANLQYYNYLKMQKCIKENIYKDPETSRINYTSFYIVINRQIKNCKNIKSLGKVYKKYLTNS